MSGYAEGELYEAEELLARLLSVYEDTGDHDHGSGPEVGAAVHVYDGDCVACRVRRFLKGEI